MRKQEGWACVSDDFATWHSNQTFTSYVGRCGWNGKMMRTIHTLICFYVRNVIKLMFTTTICSTLKHSSSHFATIQFHYNAIHTSAIVYYPWVLSGSIWLEVLENPKPSTAKRISRCHVTQKHIMLCVVEGTSTSVHNGHANAVLYSIYVAFLAPAALN